MNVQIFDRSALVRLAGDHPAIHSKLVGKFLVLTPAIIGEIQQAYAQKDAESVARLAHKMKSSAKAVGAMSLADMALALEAAGKAGNLQQIEALQPGRLTDLMREFADCADVQQCIT